MPIVTVEVNIDLDDFKDDLLIEEVRSRGFHVGDEEEAARMERIYHLIRLGKPQCALEELEPYLLDILGKAA
ncbi:hypothetical protein ACLQ9R_01280 [Bordetella hinzii]|uniref:hypothetical protein n=1 Tax=Bordetella hinzii TaxID=103855 RepID=UPI0039FC3EFE